MISQLIRFGIVGVIAMASDFGVLALLKEYFGTDVLVASAISFCVSVIINYVLSMAFVFKSKNKNKIKEFIVFVLLSVGGLGLNQLILWAGLKFTTTYYLIIKLIATVVIPIYNFVTRKIFLESKEK